MPMPQLTNSGGPSVASSDASDSQRVTATYMTKSTTDVLDNASYFVVKHGDVSAQEEDHGRDGWTTWQKTSQRSRGRQTWSIQLPLEKSDSEP